MNKVFLVGRLARDPELRYSSNNTASMRCAIAVDRQFAREGEERGADFINIVAFGTRAETMKKYLVKGSQIAIDGRIQTGSYDGQDGKRVYTTDVVIDNFQFLDSRSSRPMGETNNNDSVTPYDFGSNESSSNASTIDVSSDPFADFGSKIEINDSDLPF